MTQDNVLKFRIVKVNMFQRLVLFLSSGETQNSNEWFYLTRPTESIFYFKKEEIQFLHQECQQQATR
jgi:hypothetical protein